MHKQFQIYCFSCRHYFLYCYLYLSTKITGFHYYLMLWIITRAEVEEILYGVCIRQSCLSLTYCISCWFPLHIYNQIWEFIMQCSNRCRSVAQSRHDCNSCYYHLATLATKILITPCNIWMKRSATLASRRAHTGYYSA